MARSDKYVIAPPSLRQHRRLLCKAPLTEEIHHHTNSAGIPRALFSLSLLNPHAALPYSGNEIERGFFFQRSIMPPSFEES